MLDTLRQAHLNARSSSPAAYDVYTRQSLTSTYVAHTLGDKIIIRNFKDAAWTEVENYLFEHTGIQAKTLSGGYVVLTTLPPGTPVAWDICVRLTDCLLSTSPSPPDTFASLMPSPA